MSTSQSLLIEAAKHLHMARAINDEFSGKAMPAEAANEMQEHLQRVTDFRRKADLAQHEDWLREPQHKHAMVDSAPGGYGVDGGGQALPGFKAFMSYVRGTKAALVEDSTGQNLVPSDFAGVILKSLAKESVMRQIAFVRPTTKNKVEIGSISIGVPAWGKLETGSTAPDGLGATPAAKDSVEVFDLTALALIGVDELEDSDDNLQSIVSQALAEAFAEVEDNAFFGGNGTGQPWAATHGVTQNVTASVNATPTPDDLKKLPFQVPARMRRNGVFVGHSAVEQAVALMKDNQGDYLFQPSAAAGEPGKLFGYRWYTADGLAAPTTTGTATDASVLFGDYRAGYMVADRQQFRVQVLRERYAELGKVGLLCTKRSGGDVIRPTALAKYLL